MYTNSFGLFVLDIERSAMAETVRSAHYIYNIVLLDTTVGTCSACIGIFL